MTEKECVKEWYPVLDSEKSHCSAQHCNSWLSRVLVLFACCVRNVTDNGPAQCTVPITDIYTQQDAQLSQRDRAAVCVIVFAKSRTLELGDNDLRTL